MTPRIFLAIALLIGYTTIWLCDRTTAKSISIAAAVLLTVTTVFVLLLTNHWDFWHYITR